MSFEAYKIYEEYEPDKYKTSTQKKVEKALDIAEKEGISKINESGVEFEEAREILGEDFFGAEEFETAFGLKADEIPPIPYTIEDLEKAKENGEMLVLRIDMDNQGLPLTLERINEIIQQRMNADEGKLLYKVDLYVNEKFYKETGIRPGWRIIGKGLIEGSTSKDYIDQTKVLRDHLASLEVLTEEELEGATDADLQKIRDLMASDWQQAAKQLSELPINVNHRRTAPEIIYDWVMRFKNRGDRMLEATYDWSNTLSSVGTLVRVGNADPHGAGVFGWHPGHRDDDLGVVSLR